MNDTPVIEILLGTYNGEKYLREQLKSLIEQDYPNIRILVGDDASTDSTPNILKSFQEKYPDKIQLVFFKNNYGIVKNFSRLLELSEAPYLMLADQDDLWFPDKVSKTWEKMQALEAKWGSEKPLLVHTDAEVVDNKLELIAASNWEHQGLLIQEGAKLEKMLIQNCMQGCTMLFNRALCDLGTPIPMEGFVHDYWLALVATSCGHTDYVPEATMFYRQHDSNRFGAVQPSWTTLLRPFYLKPTNTRLMQGTLRAYILYKRYQNLFSEEDRKKIEIFIGLKYGPVWKELYYRWKYGFFFHGFLRNIKLVLATLFLGRVDKKYQLHL